MDSLARFPQRVWVYCSLLACLSLIALGSASCGSDTTATSAPAGDDRHGPRHDSAELLPAGHLRHR